MNAASPAVGAEVHIGLVSLGALIHSMTKRGYEVIGPVLQDGAISYQTITTADRLPAGWTSEQAPGSYRVKQRPDRAVFGYATGPNSLKSFLHPAEIQQFTAERNNATFRIIPNREPRPQYAFLGVRACDLAAMGVQDHVFCGEPYRDTNYQGRRDGCLVVAVHCTEPAETCFCTSMGGGPRARSGFDLALTETDPGEFLVEVGTAAGAELLSEVAYARATPELRERSRTATDRAARGMKRQVDTTGIRELLQENFESPQWGDVAGRCLACGNCTMACPTCFCTAVEDTTDLTGDRAERWEKWDSCFTLDFSYIHGGSVRHSIKSRYRQWLTHKLSYWFDQFGASGCVGCGRCITWCPVGIDITKEVAAIRAAAGLKEEMHDSA